MIFLSILLASQHLKEAQQTLLKEPKQLVLKLLFIGCQLFFRLYLQQIPFFLL
jgi:hypothetical protein